MYVFTWLSCTRFGIHKHVYVHIWCTAVPLSEENAKQLRVGTVVFVVPTLHSMCVCVAIDVCEVKSVVILIFLLVLFSVTVRCREYGLSRWSANRKNTMW